MNRKLVCFYRLPTCNSFKPILHGHLFIIDENMTIFKKSRFFISSFCNKNITDFYNSPPKHIFYLWKNSSLNGPRRLFHFLNPIVRLLNNLKLWCWFRVSNSKHLYLTKNKAYTLICMIIKPLNCSTMFWSCFSYKPNYQISRLPGCISN